MRLASKAFTRIQRFIYKDLLTQNDWTCPDGMTMEDVGKQCFPVSCYAGMIMHHVYRMPSPSVIVADAIIKDGDTKVIGRPHAFVYYNNWVYDFSDLTREIQYPVNDIIGDIPTFGAIVTNGGDQALGIMRIDSMYHHGAYSILYSSALPEIKRWRPKSTDSKKRPKRLEFDRGGFQGSLGFQPDPLTIKRIGFHEDDDIYKVSRE